MSQIKIKGILSYPHLFTPRAVEAGGELKYSTSVLIRKDDPQLAQLQAIVEQEKANGFPSGFPANGKLCLKDCATEPSYSGDMKLHNFMVLSTNNKDKPQVVDMNLQPLMDPAQIYAGCVAWVMVGIQAYSMPVNKGVGAYVNGVMPTGEEGELGRIDGRPTAEQMFGDVAGGAPMSPLTQAAAPAAPQATAPAAPQAAAPAPMSPPAPPAHAAPAAPAALQMTAAANGATYEAMIAAGWTDDMMLAQGMAIRPSFA